MWGNAYGSKLYLPLFKRKREAPLQEFAQIGPYEPFLNFSLSIIHCKFFLLFPEIR